MKIVVCIKQVQGEINPFCASALETALQIENSQISVVCMGPRSCEPLLQKLTRLGVSNAILLTDKNFAGADTLATAYTLSLIIKKLSPDLVFCGRQSIDGDTAQTPASLSTMLDFEFLPYVLGVTNISNEEIQAKTRLGEKSVKKPCVLSIERTLTLRKPSIRSKPKEIEILSASDLNADLSLCGTHGSPTKVIKTFENEQGKRKCKFIDSSEFKTILHEEINKPFKISQMVESSEKLDTVLCLSKDCFEMAGTIAKKIELLEETNPQKIADYIITTNTQTVLFPSNLQFRAIAPQVAAILKTGLCADCTKLEVENGKLLMYRPALGGNLIAKIACETTPTMATVRYNNKLESNVIISCGVGATYSLEKIKDFASQNNYQLTASRSLVDKGLAPYEQQVGLTGIVVSPKVYVAIGIGGAVHHTCAITGSNTIIAINPDKNAKIFDFADFGIVANIEDVL